MPIASTHSYTHSFSFDHMMSRAGSTRWCPTPEQLMILEEMYRSGVRTPNASQIQHITTHLSYYGKIEGKNVFYWFQNHKARERQKLRRKLSKQLQLQQHHQLMMHCQVPNHPQQQLFHCFDHSPLAGSFYNSAKLLPLPQEGLMTEDASSKKMNYTWRLGIQERTEMEKSMMGMYGRDWMVVVDNQRHVAPPSSLLQPSDWSKPPLKTLELFPITSTNLKEECNNKNSSRQN